MKKSQKRKIGSKIMTYTIGFLCYSIMPFLLFLLAFFVLKKIVILMIGIQPEFTHCSKVEYIDDEGAKEWQIQKLKEIRETERNAINGRAFKT